MIVSGAREYCEAETFLARCKADEVVVMETALYGRMSVGRCVIKDYGYVGCKADVLKHMDNKCSGRRSCEIRIPDSTLDDVNPCPKDFKTFLEAGYKCVKGALPWELIFSRSEMKADPSSSFYLLPLMSKYEAGYKAISS